jgi:hypothetical protein
MTSTEYYRRSKSARSRKKAYDSEYQKAPAAVAKRVELNRINRRSQASGKTSVGDGKDYSHTIRGYESASKNRGRREKSRLRGSKRS